MDTRLLRALALAAVTAAAGCAGAGPVQTDGTNAGRWLDAPYVVMLSMDGFRHDYLDLHPSPALQRIAAEGVRADRMIPGFPSKTFPTHYTVATGMYAEHHGLVGNRFWAPDKGAMYDMANRNVVEDGTWYRGEPIWVTAERQGMLAASYFFVGSEADVGGVRPTYWHRFDGSVPNDDRVDGVLAWLALPPERRPHMITLYFSDLDDAGHRYGPGSAEVQNAVATVDASIDRLLRGIEALPHGDQVTLILVSDHGMMRSEADRAQAVDLTLFPGIRMVEGGPYASFVVEEGGVERAAVVRDSLQAMLPEAEVWLRQDVPERFHYSADPRIGDIVALAEPGATVVPDGSQPSRDGFTHGWDNRVPEMGAIFLARGPGIGPAQRIGAFESVNVYPFIAHILGLTPNPEIDGSLDVLAPVLSDGQRP
jgi:predicted AlkP superfamily pyrophosphatase or phosphodiesterase